MPVKTVVGLKYLKYKKLMLSTERTMVVMVINALTSLFGLKIFGKPLFLILKYLLQGGSLFIYISGFSGLYTTLKGTLTKADVSKITF